MNYPQHMSDVIDIATHFCKMYTVKYGCVIDEMKLHKLLYLAQRESLIQRRRPLFAEEFRAWKYGPVLLSVRKAYHDGELTTAALSGFELPESDRHIVQYVFSNYAWKNSWSLSRLTHSEFSWRNARQGLEEWEHGNREIKLSDIDVDARRVEARRNMLAALGVG